MIDNNDKVNQKQAIKKTFFVKETFGLSQIKRSKLRNTKKFKNQMTKIIKLNVFDKKLKLCSKNPLTGFYRDGCCSSSNQDSGEHHICVVVKDDFLNFSKKNGNDLITTNE